MPESTGNEVVINILQIFDVNYNLVAFKSESPNDAVNRRSF